MTLLPESVELTDERTGALPEFAAVMRGYDRGQVDDYVRRLQDFLADEERRSTRAETQVEQLRAQVAELSRDLAEARQRPPVAESPYEGLGDRVESILRLAFEEATTVRENGRTAAAELVADARETIAAERQHAELDLQEVARRRDAVVGELRRVQDVLATLGLRAAVPEDDQDAVETRVVRIPDAGHDGT